MRLATGSPELRLMDMCEWRKPALASLCLALAAISVPAQGRFGPVQVVSSRTLQVGGAALQVDFGPGRFKLGDDAILDHVRMAATAVAAYYGRFPVPRARVLIVPAEGQHGVMHGTTWGDVAWGGMGHWPGFTRISIGTKSTQADLAGDWMMTHELVHMAFPSVPDKNHWIEEGIAVYVEPIARVQAGELKPAKIWHDMLRDMFKGEPQPGDQGLDHTHTWGRTYWGGAMFCLVADVTIRRETHNEKGLQDALRAIVQAGGTIDHNWDLENAFEIGDRATGTHVLTRMYAEWKDKPVTVGLDKLWQELGVSADGDTVRFDDAAPFASVRRGITERK
ncbi:MAG TPA: hypothetical protein VG225_00500 [Terracidiphilus sp.]|jgi:hypothetical protein|nr:hypothetical protein [Terracidiphilus sp.]